jgi:Reverse transcriptase (RNA-dependent DNA polymerase)
MAMSKADQLFLISLNIHLSSLSVWKMVYRLIYTDFSKAFDKVRHQLLLIKLALTVPPDRGGLLRSYFSGRRQRVRIGSCVSKEIKVTSGVPQGSHLGPLCFIWFVNDIAQIFKYVRVLFYADDMKLYLPRNNEFLISGHL